MPALLAAPWFIPLMTGIGASAAVGGTAYQLANQPGTPAAPAASTTNAAAPTLTAAQKAALLAQSGNTQAQTGGSLTPTGFTAASANAAGVPSDLNSIMQSLGGSGGGSSAPISGGTTTPNSGPSTDPNNLQNLSDLLK